MSSGGVEAEAEAHHIRIRSAEVEAHSQIRDERAEAHRIQISEVEAEVHYIQIRGVESEALRSGMLGRKRTASVFFLFRCVHASL